jgi:hypothetical protein
MNVPCCLGVQDLSEFGRISLTRMVGLIGFAVVATTFQASARSVSAAPPEDPARQESPDRNSLPGQKLEQKDQRQRLILVIAPLTCGWSDSTGSLMLDGSGPAPEAGPAFLHAPPVTQGPIPLARALETGAFRLSHRATRAWLMARYPHAPPA